MTSEIDVYRGAHTLIQQHGEGAAIQAAMEADAALDKGDHPPPTDFEPRLRVEVARGVDPAQYPVLGAEVASAVRTTLGFSPAVEFADQGDIASAHKTRRVLRPYCDDS